ncbi:sulfite exporter TauE/SafE family protein [Brevibacterium sediminis]|uniref:Probable membrane transporter protein n=1 Tax=Brevibacterium sediminis TaxID=1857024 RepID=A0A5C4WZN7_9MICO|nr:sulfite exporter TauE/SafE family protein [Brevibacterium sediminis]TNM53529.1 sulfite exporter TauE/SafE family protein [Brevibacterium sediminis]
MEIVQYLIIGIVVLGSACLQGSIGFGLGMITAPVLALLRPDLLPSALLLLATLTSFTAFTRERQDVDWKLVGWGALGRLPGIAIGTAAVVLLPDSGLSLMLAITVLAGAAFSLVGWSPAASHRNMFFASSVSGIFGTATSIGGPPISLIMRSLDPSSMRSTMSAYFTLGSILSLTGLTIGGEVGTRHLIAAAVLLPFMLIGLWLSNFVIRRADRRLLYRLAVGSSIIGALLVIAEVVRSHLA